MNNKLQEKIVKLTRLTEEKLDGLKKIEAMTREQSTVLTAESLDRLNRLIAEKQQYIDRINSLDQEFGCIYDDIRDDLSSDQLDCESQRLYDKLKQVVLSIQHCIKVIAELEERNKTAVHQELDRIKQKMKSVNDGKKGYSVYKKLNKQTDGAFIDKKK